MMGVFLVVATATIFRCHWLNVVSMVKYLEHHHHVCLLGSQSVCHIADDLARETLSAIWVNNGESDGVSGVSSHGPVAPIPARYVNSGVSHVGYELTNQPSGPPWRVSRPPFSLGTTW
jgi:hypothetical protein